MGSDLVERVAKSRGERAAFVRKFGMMPMSVLRIHRGDLSRRMFVYQQEEVSRSSNAQRLMRSAEADRCIRTGAGRRSHRERMALGLMGNGSISDQGASRGGRTRVTTMPAELVAFFVKYYARRGDVYLDPFMGQGVQMQVARLLGLHYRGYDISAEFFAYIDAVRREIDDGSTTIAITLGDSRDPAEVPDGCGDFSFHSPPYWDIEFYGEEEGQLGHGRTYDEFLRGMEDVARAWLPKFKAGAYHVVNVNDFRREGAYYPYHADTIALFRRAGWVLTDTWIIEGLVGGLPKAFAVEFNLKRIAPKVHEYALVFRRP